MNKTNIESLKCVYCKEFIHLCKCKKGQQKEELIEELFGGC